MKFWHTPATRSLLPEDTLFEIGGQCAKFVALQAGIPVDSGPAVDAIHRSSGIAGHAGTCSRH
jgi:hypothetical protein